MEAFASRLSTFSKTSICSVTWLLACGGSAKNGSPISSGKCFSTEGLKVEAFIL